MPKAAVTRLKPVAAKPSLPKRKSPPIPANVAAIWGAFLYEGMLASSPSHERRRDILHMWPEGCDSLVAAACALLPEVWRQIEPRWYEKDFPGVFEYEVISPLGVCLGDYVLLNQGLMPSSAEMCECIANLIADFFRSGTNQSLQQNMPVQSPG